MIFDHVWFTDGAVGPYISGAALISKSSTHCLSSLWHLQGSGDGGDPSAQGIASPSAVTE
eukprot:m.907233 g.907233  ORF g.907233 m.907233 type:complete len:60 (+) comp23711_c0_seq22:200-379(+)